MEGELEACRQSLTRQRELAQQWKLLARLWHAKAMDAELQIKRLQEQLAESPRQPKRADPFELCWPYDLF